jgi:hypothetical protein
MKNIFLGSFISAFLVLSSGCKEGSGGSSGADNSGTAKASDAMPGVPNQVPDPVSSGSAEPGKIKVSASGDDGYAPANTLDDSTDSESRWSSTGDKEWIQYDLGDEYKLKGLDIAFYDAENRKQKFSIELKAEGGDWVRAFAGANRSHQTKYQHYGFYPRKARYVRISGNGADDRATALVEVIPVYDDEKKFPTARYAATYYVDPDGNDRNEGTSKSESLESIQEALDRAKPGDRVLLAPGRYMQEADTVRSGTEDHPITIEGPENAIVQGSGEGRVFEVSHDYIRLLGFTMDGKVNGGKSEDDYREKLLYVQGTGQHRGPKGLVIRGMTFMNAGGECLRLRYFVRGADVGFNRFENCGVHDFRFGGKKNGEAIYLGTSSTQWGDGKNPTGDADVSQYNRIHHNYFNTQGNECVDIKEGAINNVVEYNYCTGQKDSSSAGFDSRSDRNIFRYNVAVGNKGAGVRIGGHEVDGHLYGVGNDVYGNVLQDNGAGSIKLMTPDQGHICENTLAGSGRETSGDYEDNPAQSCKFKNS